MLRFSLKHNGKKSNKFEVKETEDITLGDFQKWEALKIKLDKDLLTALEVEEMPKDLSVQDIYMAYPKYIKDTIKFFSNIKDVGVLNAVSVISIFQHILNELNTKPREIDSFQFKGITYYLPESTTDLEGNKNIASEMSFDELSTWQMMNQATSSAVMGQFHNLHKQIALMCRRKGVNASLDLIKDASKFKELDLQTIRDIAFFLTKRLTKFIDTNCLPEEKEIVS